MVTIKVDSDHASRDEVADWLNDVATKIREGYTSGINWDLEEREGEGLSDT